MPLEWVEATTLDNSKVKGMVLWSNMEDGQVELLISRKHHWEVSLKARNGNKWMVKIW